MITAMCYGRISKTTTDFDKCELAGKPTCPLMAGKLRKLGDEPCCYAIFIPARFLTEYKTRSLAARKYVEECLCPRPEEEDKTCLLESTPPLLIQE